VISKYDVAAQVTINSLEDGEYHKLTAKQQRELFGYDPLGRKDVNFDSTGQGIVRVGFYTDGTNYDTLVLSYDEFAQCCNAKIKIDHSWRSSLQLTKIS
jgi:hypothetical protein